MGRSKKQISALEQLTISNSCEAYGHPDLFEKFLTQSVFFNQLNIPGFVQRGITLLHLVAGEEDIGLQTAFIILNLCRCIKINLKTLDDGRSPLYIASCRGQAKMVGLFLDQQGVNVNIREHKYKSTPLQTAAKNGNSEVVKLLLACRGINVNLADDSGYTALHYAAGGKSEIVSMLLGHAEIDVNIQSSQGATPLHCASLLGCADVVRLLVEHGDLNPNLQTEDGSTAVFTATEKGHIEVVKILLGCVGVNINKPDNTVGVTPLIIAVENGNFEVAKLLLDSNLIANINVKDREFGRSALLIAAGEGSKGHPKIVNILLKYKGIDVNQQSKEGISPLMAGCTKGNIAIVYLLLACKDLNLDLKDGLGYSSLYIAVEEEHTKVVEMLLDKGIDVNATDESGVTALHLAIQTGQTDVVKALLSNEKINVNIQIFDKLKSPLQLAAGIGDIASMKLLLNHKAIDVNLAVASKSDNTNSNCNALLFAVAKNKPDAVRLLAGDIRVDVNLELNRSSSGLSPLSYAAAENMADIVAILLNLKWEVIDPFFIEQSLRWASIKGHIEVLKVLLDLCQSYVVKNEYGQDHVCDAARGGHADLVKLFLEVEHFDIEKKNSKGETALSIAQRLKHTEVVEIITKHMKKMKRRKRREIELKEMKEAIAAFDTLD